MEASQKEMTWIEEILADAHMRLKYLDKEIDKLVREKLDVLSVIQTLEHRQKTAAPTERTKKQPAKPKEKGETITFMVYGENRYLKKPVIEALLKLKAFTTSKVVAEVRKWHRISSVNSAHTIATFYIKYLEQNGFIEQMKKRRRHKVWYSVKKERQESLAALVEGL